LKVFRFIFVILGRFVFLYLLIQRATCVHFKRSCG